MTLTNDGLTAHLDGLLAGWENEVVEFKEAACRFSADKTGEYVRYPLMVSPHVRAVFPFINQSVQRASYRKAVVR